MGTGSFSGVKCGRGILLTTPPSGAAVMEDCLYPPSGQHRACNGITLLDVGGWLAPKPDRLIPPSPGKKLGTDFTGGWVGIQDRSGRVREVSHPSPGFDLRSCTPSESLYRLSYSAFISIGLKIPNGILAVAK